MGAASTSPGSGEPDPGGVQTLLELAKALDQLRGTRSYGDLDSAARPRARLADSTLNNMLRGKVVPTRHTVVAFLAACGLDAETQRPWLAARDRVALGYQRAPAGAVRVREARPRLLGVHAAVQVEPGGDFEGLPPYVLRDVDAGVRSAINAAAERGGFVLLVGESCVGKTRSLYESVRAVLPDWWLVRPADADAVRCLAAEPPPRTVVWLDELQRYLDGQGGIPAAAVRNLVGARAVVVATIWPTEYRVRAADPQVGEPNQHGNDRELLRLAHVIAVAEDFSSAERQRAEAFVADRRIRAALDTPDAGFTQILAAGPDLVRHWENAPAEHCYGKAVITAALDAVRVGTTAPLTREFFNAAVPGYLSGRQQATAPADWLDHGLHYATTILRGATAALSPVPAGMGLIIGYITADYLHQRALRTRRTVHLPDAAWQALVDHHHPNDTERLADSAERRARYPEAEALYRPPADAGNFLASHRLINILAGQGRAHEVVVLLRRDHDAGDWSAAERLADLLAKQGRVAELRQRADAGDSFAAVRLAELLIEQSRVDEVRKRADAGDRYAADRLILFLAKQGRAEELRPRADAGDSVAAHQLADLLAKQGRGDDAVVLLRRCADAGDEYAAARLVELLAKQGRAEELRERVDTGDRSAAVCLVQLLVKQGQTEEALGLLRVHADAAPDRLIELLVDLLAKQGRAEELRERADAGDARAASRLAKLLVEQDLELLVEQDRIDELTQRADTGDVDAGGRLVRLLVEQGRAAELCERADAGDVNAAFQLPELLAEQGRIDELRQRVDAGGFGGFGAFRLTELLIEHGQINEALVRLRERADSGDWHAAEQLITLLVEQGRTDELTGAVAAGTAGAAQALQRLSPP